jgi:CHAD domain-containing protein
MKEADFSFQADEPVSAGLGRIARQLVESAVHCIECPAPARDEDVHGVRTVIKRLRAILLLIGPVISEVSFRREDAHLKNAAGRLASSREATIVRQTLASLQKSRSNRRQRDALAAALASLKQQAESEAALEEAMNQVAQDLEQTGRRLPRLRVTASGWNAIEPGLHATYRQGRRRMRAAFAHDDDEAFHRWRIRVKNFFYELQFIEPICPQWLGGIVADLKKLQGRLGANNDLAVLRALLQETPDAFGGTETVERVVECLNAKSRRLKQACKPLGKAIFDEKPGRLVRKLGDQWNHWQKQK